MFKKCVTVNLIHWTNSNKCRITYDDGKIYNVDQLTLDNQEEFTFSDYSSISRSNLCQEHLMTKLEMFKRYKVRLKEKLDNCTFKDNYNEVDDTTCNDDILRKWYHYINLVDF